MQLSIFWRRNRRLSFGKFRTNCKFFARLKANEWNCIHFASISDQQLTLHNKLIPKNNNAFTTPHKTFLEIHFFHTVSWRIKYYQTKPIIMDKKNNRIKNTLKLNTLYIYTENTTNHTLRLTATEMLILVTIFMVFTQVTVTVAARFFDIALDFICLKIVYLSIAEFSLVVNSLSLEFFLTINKQRPKYMHTFSTFVYLGRWV